MAYFHPDQFPPEFVDRVRRAHAPVRMGSSIFEPHGFSSGAVEAMDPKEHGFVLDDTATIQRGTPESLMHHVQRAAGGGIMSWLAEHVGDLTHRLNEGGGTFGTEYVAPKVHTALHTLEHGYGVEREHREQMASNKTDLDELSRVGEAYSHAHSLVPVYNLPSYHARRAAMAIGEGDFERATINLRGLKRQIGDPDKFKYLMSQQGSIEFLRDREERGY